jgi:peptidoglycan/LPS O-acetylase OafA/YrhL
VLNFPRKNNLEWLRLVFAIQVLVTHLAGHLSFNMPAILSNFPGVPAFFFVSGFLIYASYLNAPGRCYFFNRFLRLWPALFFVTIGGFLVTIVAHGWGSFQNNLLEYLIWIFAQLTLGQTYNPLLFRDIGVGVINGSLWTITVEVIFYLLVPFIVWAERRFRFIVVALTTLSFLVYAVGPHIWTNPIYRQKTIYDFIALTPIVWGWMFGFGILAFKHFILISKILKYFPILIFPMIFMIYFENVLFFNSTGNRLGLIYCTCYFGIILWVAFATPFIRLTFDLSYGVYIWHAPVINLILTLSIPSVPLAFALTILFAAMSWFFVEKPSLKLKHKFLKPVG